MVQPFGGDIHTDPRGIALHGIPHKVQAGEAAWEFLSGFAWYQRKAHTNVAALRDMVILSDAIEDIKVEIVRDMRSEGMTWGEVGDALGISRQGARQRYGGAGIA